MDKFNAAGASVIGVSLDNDRRRSTSSPSDPDYCAGKLPVASDMRRQDREELRAQGDATSAQAPRTSRGSDIDHGFAERTTFVITKDGKVAATIGNMKPAENVLKALETVQNLSGKKPTA